MKVGDIGEFGLIERLQARLAPLSTGRLVVGIGDDAAVWHNNSAEYTVATTDTLIEGVHFVTRNGAWRDTGWKALAVSISDIAAMGGTPSFALVTLALPREMEVADVEELYAGLRECADAYGVTVAGGDMVSAAVFSITVALMGEPSTLADGRPQLLRRNAARSGDAIAVTGGLGGAAAGLRALLPNPNAIDPSSARLVQRHLRPRPRVAAGRAAVAAGVRCAIDISDGLIQDVGHVCDASGVGAELHSVAMDWGLARMALDGEIPVDEATQMAAAGGEDYELVLVAPAERLQRIGDSKAEIIGRIVPYGARQQAAGKARVRLIDARGDDVELRSGGWDHFAAGART